MKRFCLVTSLFRVGLLGVALVVLNGSCTQRGDELQQAGGAIRQHAARNNPAFRTERIRFSGTIDAVDSDGTCACIKVCNSKGENCTGCSCSPASCGTCG
jgi:hypothetical protein